MYVPRTRTGSLGHLNPNGFSSQCLQGPTHRALVFKGFNLKPDMSPKLSNTVMALLTELLFFLRRVVSSAN